MSVVVIISFIQLLILFIFISFSEAREFLVGGSSDSWKIPGSDSDALNKWAEEYRFRIGDTLVWKYESDKDSVLEVNKDAYVTCNTSTPIEQYNDGNTTIKLTRSGPYYFISGALGHCQKGEKLTVIVLSTKHLRPAVTSPAPSPTPAATGLLHDHASRFEGFGLATMAVLVGFGYFMM